MRALASSVVSLCLVASASAQVPSGWEKVSGAPSAWSGKPDGIEGDRENSYAWSMDVLGRHLYVGTNRNVFGTMFTLSGVPPSLWQVPGSPIPTPVDLRGRIYRMDLRTRAWERHYLAPAIPGATPLMGPDSGYRMMKTYCAGGRSTLYVGSTGMGLARLLAITGTGAPVPVFAARKAGKIVSVRAIAPHHGELFWAAEDENGPAIWHARDPLAAVEADPYVDFPKITPPDAWFPRNGTEILDMVSYDGALYVFFLPYDLEHSGFWCAKLRKTGAGWRWTLVVGDPSQGARYEPGMGRPANGGAVPVVFHGRVYVGTLEGAAFRMMNGIFAPGTGPANPLEVMGGPAGMQIFRFGPGDRWERVMPPERIDDPAEVERLSGFGNPLNKYIWRFGKLDGRLYAGTFDIGTGLQVMSPLMGGSPFTPPTPAGFDLYSTWDGEHWVRASRDGFADPWNYGTRVFASDPRTGDLFMGTANPFYGCQVWRKRSIFGRLIDLFD